MSTKPAPNAAPTNPPTSSIESVSKPYTSWHIIYNISLAVLLIAMTMMSFHYGLSGDEVDMNEYGKAILKYFTSFGSDQTVFNMPKEYNRDGVIQYYGGLFDLLCAIVNKFSPFAEYTTRHILNAWAGFAAIYFASKIMIRIAGKQAGTIAVWLMFLSPFFLGHAMNNPKDIPFAATYIMAIYFIIRLFDRLPNASKLDYLWAILSIGATINVRVGGILLIPYLAVLAGLLFLVPKWFQQEKTSLGLYIKPVFITGILGYFAGGLLWPYALQNPFSNPLTALSEMSNFKVNIRQLFEGTKIFSGELPASFLPTSFIITNSYAVLGGIVLGIFFLWSFRKHKNAPFLYFVLFTGFFPLAYIIYSKSNVYHAWRHVLFIFPSLIIVAAWGWHSIIELLDAKKIKIAGLGMLGFLLLEPAYFILTTFPNTITYHNAIVGGVKGAYTNYEMDYYYNSLKQCADWFKKNELPKYKSSDTILVYSNAAHLLNKYFTENKNVKVDYIRYYERNMKPWDYVIFHIALIPEGDLKTKVWLPSSTLFQAQSQGQTLCAIIKRPSADDLKAFDCLQRNQVDSAMMYFNSYLLKDSSNTTILNMAGRILLQTNNLDKASNYFAHSFNIDTSQYSIGFIANGINDLRKNNPQQALNDFNNAAQDENYRQVSYKLMGDIYTQMGNQTEALKLYQAAGLR